MAGFEINRIVGLDSKFAETIQCSICLLILNNPLMTKCGHNYCNQCLKETVEKGVKSLPDCRKVFTKKRPKESSDNSNVVFRRNRNVFVFSKNFTLRAMIGKLKISCDYDSNGCKESVELESLSQHMTRCEYRFCKTCEFRPIGESDEHNCIEVLKNESNEWKEKYEKSLNTIKELEDKLKAENIRIKELNEKLEEELRQKNEWKVKYENEVKRIDMDNEQKLNCENSNETLTEVQAFPFERNYADGQSCKQHFLDHSEQMAMKIPKEANSLEEKEGSSDSSDENFINGLTVLEGLSVDFSKAVYYLDIESKRKYLKDQCLRKEFFASAQRVSKKITWV